MDIFSNPKPIFFLRQVAKELLQSFAVTHIHIIMFSKMATSKKDTKF